MPNNKKRKSEAEKIRQKARTRKNKIKKYEKLIKENPNDTQVKTWNMLLSKLK